MIQAPERIRIEIVSDIVCPWCLIGVRRVDRAIASRPALEVDVVFYPFLLAETESVSAAPSHGRARRRYGSPGPMLRRVEAVARADGIDLDFSRVGPAVCTLSAHTLLRHAGEKGTQRGLARAFYGAHFVEGRDVSDPQVLASIASSFGFSAGEALRLLQDPAEASLTRDHARAVAERGLLGVPHTTIGLARMAGVQSIAALGRALDQVRVQ